MDNTNQVSINLTAVMEDDNTKRKAYNDFITVLTKIIEKYGADTIKEIEKTGVDM